MDGMLRDIRFALRGLTRKPSFSAVAVATLALGIGATTAAFSLVNAIVLRSLPFPNADRLVSVVGNSLTRDVYPEWRAALPAVDRMEAYSLDRAVLTGQGPAAQLRIMPVSSGFLDLLGARTGAGRLLAEAEYDASAAPAAVISHRLWVTKLHSDPGVAGQVLNLDGIAWTIVGVLTPEFDPIRFREIDVFVPIAHASRAGASTLVRLAPGSSIEQLRQQADALASTIEPGAADRTGARINVQWLTDIYNSELRRPLAIAFGAAAIVLLIACVNVASLLFARATERVSELAVRTALGASRIDLVRQLLVESSVLAIAGVAGGIALAWWAVDLLPRIAPPFGPQFDQVGLDPVVLAFAIGVTLLTTIAAGLAPALAASRAAARAATGMPRSTSTRSVRRLRESLIVAEIGLALMLVIASTLLVRTFIALRPTSPGFLTANRITAGLDLPGPDFVDPDRVPLMRSILERLRALPGSPDVAAVTDLPLTGVTMVIPVTAVDGQPAPPSTSGRPAQVHFRSATPGYFDVLDLHVIAGRALSDTDAPAQPHVLVVNQTAARRLWPDIANPIGRTIAFDEIAPGIEFVVVGITADARLFGVNTRASAEVFASWWQVPVGRITFVVHDPTRAISTEMLIQTVAAADPDLPLTSVQSFAAIAADSVALQRFQMILMLLAGSLALILALVGCYAALAYNVAQRTREFGVRIALGATPRHIQRTVVARGGIMIAAGLGLGLTGAAISARILESLLYGVAATDTATFVATAAALGTVATFAALIPARRAASVEPLRALRAE